MSHIRQCLRKTISNSEEQCIKNDRSGSLPQGYFLVLHCASLLRRILHMISVRKLCFSGAPKKRLVVFCAALLA